jgi:hypothetical protein
LDGTVVVPRLIGGDVVVAMVGGGMLSGDRVGGGEVAPGKTRGGGERAVGDVVEDDVVELDVVELVSGGRKPNASGGAVKIGSAGTPASAARMYRLKIRAGKLPPDTLIPWTSSIGMSPSRRPTQTAVASWGVNPTNQALPWFSVVPVLPASGRPIEAA